MTETVEVGPGHEVELWPSPEAPLEVADMLALDLAHDDVSTIGRLRGSWWRWSGTRWSEAHDEEVRGLVYDRLRHAVTRDKSGDLRPWNPTARRVSDVLDALASSSAALPHDLEPGQFVDGAAAPGLIPMRGGVLDLTTRTVRPHHPRLFTTSALPYDIALGGGEAPPAWSAFLDSAFGHDADGPAKVALLREWFGYLLSGRTEQQKGLLLVGPTRSGKGTLLRIAEALVGTANTAATTFGTLARPFGLAGLNGKTLAVVGDQRERPAPAALEMVLSIIGGDAVLVDRKFRDPETVRLSARFMVASNEVPDLGDRSAAAVGRFLIVRMTRSHFGTEDLGLGDRLLGELPGIAAWALVGLDELTERGRFAEPDSAREERETLSRDASPVRQFLDDALVVGADHAVPRDIAYAAWTAWCAQHGFRPGNVATFGRLLREQVPGLGEARPRGADGNRVRAYTGLAFRRSYTGDGGKFGSIEDPTLRRRAAGHSVPDPE